MLKFLTTSQNPDCFQIAAQLENLIVDNQNEWLCSIFHNQSAVAQTMQFYNLIDEEPQILFSIYITWKVATLFPLLSRCPMGLQWHVREQSS